ncbi:MAG: hypothetical protein A2848_00290 [Candidatus Magasanikbacteria bacterium RIFCSPHIGHO2_01_FULL_50_8]|nr:MAG: hypothetical protein A2848_00290 [Candidatus Magasanikbacteria bacterium RIFCSPHIGHO2_01_FULL_50_8]
MLYRLFVFAMIMIIGLPITTAIDLATDRLYYVSEWLGMFLIMTYSAETGYHAGISYDEAAEKNNGVTLWIRIQLAGRFLLWFLLSVVLDIIWCLYLRYLYMDVDHEAKSFVLRRDSNMILACCYAGAYFFGLWVLPMLYSHERPQAETNR